MLMNITFDVKLLLLIQRIFRRSNLDRRFFAIPNLVFIADFVRAVKLLTRAYPFLNIMH